MKYRKSAGDRPMKNHTFINLHNLMKLVCIIVLFLSFTISACDFGKVDASAEIISKKESNMESTQSTTTVQHEIPPIDAVVLPEIETATFAMG
jgi:hypothetical protein